MAISLKQFLLIAAVAIVGLSYFLYIPLPDGLEETWKLRILLNRYRMINQVADFAEMIGADSAQNSGRKITNFLMTNDKPPIIKGIKTEDYTFDGVPVRLYRPISATSPSPCVIYIHGGGWSISSVDVYDETVAEFAVKTEYVFVSIDYRLAPENPFPIPFDDSFKASLYLLKHATDFGVDDKKIAIAGDSAGGNLAAAVSLKLSETEGITKLRFQWLIYPALQALDFQLPSYLSNGKAHPYFLQRYNMIVFWCNYIGISPTPDVINAFLANRHVTEKVKQTYGKYVDYRQLPSKYHGDATKRTDSDHETSDKELAEQVQDIILNPFISPLMDLNLSRVPPAFIVTTEHDLLRDDGLLYAERMRNDGIEVELYNAPHSIHGFMFWNWVWPKFDHFDHVADMFVQYAEKHFQ